MAQICKFDVKFECKFSALFYCIFNILIFLLRGKGLELRSASSSQRECKYKAKRSEAKELPFSFLWERKGLYFACG